VVRGKRKDQLGAHDGSMRERFLCLDLSGSDENNEKRSSWHICIVSSLPKVVTEWAC
jgi:hypothetical protein